MHLRPILYAVGLLLGILAGTMLIAALVDLAHRNDSWKVFAVGAVFTFIVASLLVVAAWDEKPVRLSIKDGFLLTTLSWLVLTAFAAVPFTLLGLSYTDSFFEAMSGLTTTGSTVLVGLDKLPHGILAWRAMLQGIGGLGFIVMAIIVLPQLRIGGMQLFQTESSDKSEKVVPRAIELMSGIAGIYALLIALCALTFLALGMTLFDAICHALATLSTGGFSTHDESFAFFKSPAMEWAGTLFMLSGALPFVLLIRALRGEPRALLEDEQVRGFVGFVVGVSAVLGVWLALTKGMPILDALRLASFNVVSIVTTTGFASDDYTKWGPLAVGVFLVLTFVGGCSGSTAGAIKIYRLQISGILARNHFTRLTSPNQIVSLSYNGRRLPEDVPFSIVAFLTIYIMTVGLFTLLLSALGLDLVTSLSSSAQAIGNVGPGLGDFVGPAGNYSTLPATAKWLLAFAMLLGRLELFTVLVLLRPEFWRR
ncbi:MAG: TrkH family potassium uptake protein [Hyphomicrobiaceae bacterium]